MMPGSQTNAIAGGNPACAAEYRRGLELRRRVARSIETALGEELPR
ncbi:MAG: hypothetical protein ACFB21_01020 [Opitutales bacterium]